MDIMISVKSQQAKSGLRQSSVLRATEPGPISEPAESSGTSRASARRCLLTLADLGYLEFDGKFFCPQARLLALSADYSGTRTLPRWPSRILCRRATS
jgi:DNA-binding IclR family transcriptional regulator